MGSKLKKHEYDYVVTDSKIECALGFFASLSEKNGNDVTYDVVTDYTELMQLVTA